MNVTEAETGSFELLIGSSLAYWFVFLAFLGVPPNLLVIYLMLTVKELTLVPANVLLFSASIADGSYLLGSALFNLHWAVYGNLSVCKFGGFFHISVLYGLLVAPLLAMCRYFSLNQTRAGNGQNSLKVWLFLTCKGTKTLSLTLLFYIISINMPFISADAYGRDPVGACGVAVIETAFLLAFYITAVLGAFSLSCVLTLIYYHKLNGWILNITGATDAIPHETKQAITETRNVMRLTKFLTITPIVVVGPTAVAETVFRFYEDLVPPYVGYLCGYTLNVTSALSPVFTLLFLKPFRKHLLKLVHRFAVGRWILRLFNIFVDETNVTALTAHRNTRLNCH